MKIKRMLWAFALAPAALVLAETTPIQTQPSETTNQAQSVTRVRYRRAGGVKRMFQFGRPHRETVTQDTGSRRRAGGVKSRR